MTKTCRALCLLMPFALSACRPADVVAEVGGRRLTQADVKERQRTERKEADASLEALIADERLAAAAVARELADDPAVRARLRAAERAVLAQALLERAIPNPDEKTLREAYERSSSLTARQLELAHIFIAAPAGASAESTLLAQSRATTAFARMMGGESFEDVARALSEDTITRDKGGALGVVREGQVDQRVFDAAAQLGPGATSRPLQTEYGFHVLKALSAVSKVKPPFDEARGRLERDLRNEQLQALMKQLEAGVSVKRYDDALVPLRKEGR